MQKCWLGLGCVLTQTIGSGWSGQDQVMYNKMLSFYLPNIIIMQINQQLELNLGYKQ